MEEKKADYMILIHGRAYHVSNTATQYLSLSLCCGFTVLRKAVKPRTHDLSEPQNNQVPSLKMDLVSQNQI